MNPYAGSVQSKTDRPQVKICGITRIEDALGCAAADADAVGFVFYPKSPRNVSIEQAKEIIRQVPSHVAAVGVFVNASFGEIMEKIDRCGLSGVQLHGQEAPQLVARLLNEKVLVIKALFAAHLPGFDKVTDYTPSAFLVECGQGVLPGGNAMKWDWAKAKAIPRKKPLILAGGLTPENIAEAVAQGQPEAVDVSSGVEVSPGIKDLEKIKKFIDSIPHVPVKRRIF